MVWNTVGCSSVRLDVVTNHENSVMHKDAVSCELRTESDIDSVFKKVNTGTKEFAALLDAQKMLYFLIQHNLPIHTLNKPLIEVCINHGATNLPYLAKAENASYISNRIVDEFLDCQAEVAQDTTVEKIKEGERWWMTIRISVLENILPWWRDIETRYQQELPFCRMFSCQWFSRHHLLCHEKHLSWKDYYSAYQHDIFCHWWAFSDGRKKNNGVVALLKREHPNFIDIHCMNPTPTCGFKSIPQGEGHWPDRWTVECHTQVLPLQHCQVQQLRGYTDSPKGDGSNGNQFKPNGQEGSPHQMVQPWECITDFVEIVHSYLQGSGKCSCRRKR